MKIAFTSNEGSLDGIVSERFEEGSFLIIVETDNLSLEVYPKIDEEGLDFVKKIIDNKCEAIITGSIEEAAFEPLASAGITRMKGTGYTIKESLRLMDQIKLEYIRDFRGGKGEHHHEHEDEHDYHHKHEHEHPHEH